MGTIDIIELAATFLDPTGGTYVLVKVGERAVQRFKEMKIEKDKLVDRLFDKIAETEKNAEMGKIGFK
jgi:hypothetical protein